MPRGIYGGDHFNNTEHFVGIPTHCGGRPGLDMESNPPRIKPRWIMHANGVAHLHADSEDCVLCYIRACKALRIFDCGIILKPHFAYGGIVKPGVYVVGTRDNCDFGRIARRITECVKQFSATAARDSLRRQEQRSQMAPAPRQG